MNTKSIVSIGMLLLAFSGNLHAQHHDMKEAPATGIMDTTVLTQLLNEKGINNREVQMEVVNFPVGSASAAHRHPCPTFVYILEGEIESVFDGVRHIYKQGDSFYEHSYGLHSVTRNSSTTKPARILVFFINAPAKSNFLLAK